MNRPKSFAELLGCKVKVQQHQRESNSIGHGGFPMLASSASAPRLGRTGGVETMVPGDRGRGRGHPARDGVEAQWRPCGRTLRPARDATNYAAAQGRRYMPEPRAANRERPTRREIPEATLRSGYDIPERGIDHGGVAPVFWEHGPRSGTWAHEFISAERSLEHSFGVKKRVGTMRDKRNGIPRAFPGDKLYSAVEYSNDFYKTEGWLSGSCVGKSQRLTGASGGQRGALAVDASPSKKRVSYAAKRAMQDLRDEIDGVGTLDRQRGAGADAKQQLTWEQTTGCFLDDEEKVAYEELRVQAEEARREKDEEVDSDDE